MSPAPEKHQYYNPLYKFYYLLLFYLQTISPIRIEDYSPSPQNEVEIVATNFLDELSSGPHQGYRGIAPATVQPS